MSVVNNAFHLCVSLNLYSLRLKHR